MTIPISDAAALSPTVHDVRRAESPLLRLAAIAHEAGIEHVATDAMSLATRLAEGRFYVACVGQFKRGKSTLLNALVGEAVLPTGVVPVTSVVTIVRHGAPWARVRFVHGWEDIQRPEIAAYVTEEQNPGNRKGVVAVEVFVASPLLAAGMCLVDTPGIGSTILGNTAATQTFVPQVDAALVVLGADPPISADELALVARLAEQRIEHLVFVLNKADRPPDDERREARAFIEQVLAEHLRNPVGPLFEISAVGNRGESASSYDWQELRTTLESLAGDAGCELVRAAELRGIELYADRLLYGVSEDRSALLRPLADSERRIAMLKGCVAEAERSLGDLSYLLRAEQDRLEQGLAIRQREFLSRAIPNARAELCAIIATLPTEHRSALRNRATAAAQDVFHRHLERWRAEEQPAAEKAYAEATRRSVELADDFLRRLATSGEPALTALPQRVAPEAGLRTRSRLYYTEMLPLTARSPFTRLLDLVRSRERLRHSVGHEVGGYLERLLTTNAARLTNDLRDRVRESRDRLDVELRGHIRDVYRSAERALERARERLAAGESAVRAALERLDALAVEVTAIRSQERGGGNDGHRIDPCA